MPLHAATRRRGRLPALALLALLAALALGAGSCGRDEPAAPRGAAARRSLLVVTVDTLRADHLGSYGYERQTSPVLDALAAQGVLFEHATTPRPKTSPSMTSMLSGRYPHEHLVRTNFGRLPDVRLAVDPLGPLRPDPESPALLAERLSAAGLATGAVVSNYVLTADASGLARGFAHYDDRLDSFEATREDMPERKAAATTDAALAWLRAQGERPFFLWVHYIDPHGAYTPPPEHDIFAGPPRGRVPLAAMREERPLTEDGRRIFVALHNLLRDEQGKRVLELGRYVDLYDGEIRYVDHELGRLLAELAHLGREEDTLVVFTADHGESLGEHGIWFEHGYDLYEPSLRLPFVARLPRAAGGAHGLRRTEPVDLIDLVPTALEWLALEPEPGLPGVSLLAALREGQSGLDPERIAFSERLEFGFVQRAARSRAFKLVHNEHSPDPQGWPFVAPRELYELAADPGERANLHGSDQPRVALERARLEEALLRFARGDRVGGAAAERDLVASLDPKRRAALEAMGYVGESAPAIEEGGALPSSDAPASGEPEELLRWALAQPGALGPLALEGLARAGLVGPEELARRLAASETLGMRVRAAELCGELGDEPARAALRALAEAAPEVELRLAASYALARAGAAGGEELVGATRHWKAGVRAAAAYYLDRLGAPAPAREALRALAREPAGTVRVLAARALARAGEEDALAALRRASADPDPQVARAAGLALVELGRDEEARALAQRLRSDEHPLRRDAARELGAWLELGEARLGLARRAEHGLELRRALVHAGGLRAGGDAEELLAAAQHDDDLETRVIAAMHLLRRRVSR